MYKGLCSTFVIVSILAPVAGYSAGLPVSQRYGIAVNTDVVSVNDPDGNTDTDTVGYLSAIYTSPVNRNYPYIRMWSQLSYRSFQLDAGNKVVGQSVESLTASSLVQRSFGVSRYYRPWVGIGLTADIASYQDRQSADSDGFLAATYSDRSETTFSTVLNMGLGSKDLGEYFIAANYFYSKPMGDGIESSSVQVSVLF